MKKCNKSNPEYCSTIVEFEELSQVVDVLCDDDSIKEITNRDNMHQSLPSKEIIIDIVDQLRSIIFPGYFAIKDSTPSGLKFHVGSLLDKILQQTQIQIMKSLCFASQGKHDYNECSMISLRLTKQFLATLPKIRHLLSTDVKAAYIGDPAATCMDEAIFCYPGLLAQIYHRIAHEFYNLEIPLLPRIIAEHAHSLTGIDIHPGAKIGESFFIDHGTGVVIGETAIIGDGVRVYQGVTLGAKSFPVDSEGNPIKGIPRHPIVENDVTIYSGATILGRITLGKGSVIGGNVWLTRSIAPGTTIVQVKNRIEKFENGGGI